MVLCHRQITEAINRCGLSNDVVSSSEYIVSMVGLLVNNKSEILAAGTGRGREGALRRQRND
jgi:hypothetical protein